MTNYLTLYFACFIEAFILYFYFNSNYQCKYKPAVAILIAQAFYAIGFLPNLFIENRAYINIAVFCVLTFLYANTCFDISIKSSIFHTVIFSFIITVTELLTEVLLEFVLGNDVPVFVIDNKAITYFIGVVIAKTLMFIVAYFVSTLLSYKKNNADVSMNKSFLTLLFPVTVYILLAIIIRITLEYQLSKKLLAVIIISTGAAIVLCCLTAIYNQQIQKRENEFAELKTQQMKNEIDMQYLDLLEMKNREMQILTHDYKNHLAAIRDMSSSEEVADYIDKMNDEIKTANSACHSGNHTLDILINKYVTECYSKNVDFAFDVKLCNLNYVDSFDLVTILGNALDNALEAAEKSTAKKISFSTKRVNTYDTVIIENSCDIPPDSKLKTTKKNKGSHGIGMKSIAKTLKKYGGDYEWEYSQTDKQFKLTIILQNK